MNGRTGTVGINGKTASQAARVRAKKQKLIVSFILSRLILQILEMYFLQLYIPTMYFVPVMYIK